jgi:flavin-dependent dehydrogenase
MSTALHLMQADKTWANRTVVLDQAIHPREKLCGGGITRSGEDILNRLGLSFEPSHVPIREVQLVYQDRAYLVYGDPVFRVIRRAEFDHWLVQCGQQQGLTIRQGEAVKDIIPHQKHVAVITDQTILYAQTVVAADGSRSSVRQKLGWNDNIRLARLLEVLTPESTNQPAFQKGIAVFDFSQIDAGLQGYYWDFPSLIKGHPVMNRGVFDSRIHPQHSRISLKHSLTESLAKRGHDLADYELKGHPLHWFNQKTRFAMPRILLAGDAAGVDPFLGEGISFALAYGQVAAAAVIDAFTRQDLSFNSYKKRILAHSLLSNLPKRTMLARLIYRLEHPWQKRLLWNMAALIARGFAWYSPTSSNKSYSIET